MQKMTFNSPIGLLLLVAEKNKLTEINFLSNRNYQKQTACQSSVLIQTAEQLSAYFKGNLTTFSLPIEPSGTKFQQRIWNQLQSIPYGTTTTYLELAIQSGDSKAIRAVGRANGQNPIPIIIPCHRVIGSKGKLTGYAGGIERKKWLLKHEGAVLL